MYSENEYYAFRDKWGEEVEIFNFTQVPNLLLACQGHLGLKDGELVTLIQLLTYWYSANSKVYPSISTLKGPSQKGFSTVQGRLRRLEEKGFVKRIHREGTSNIYDLHPCVFRLKQHANVCQMLPRKRVDFVFEASRVPLSYIKYKEDQSLRTNPIKEKLENLKPNINIGSQSSSDETNESQAQNLGPDKNKFAAYNNSGVEHERQWRL